MIQLLEAAGYTVTAAATDSACRLPSGGGPPVRPHPRPLFRIALLPNMSAAISTATHGKSRQTEFMDKNQNDQSPPNQQDGHADVDLTSVFRAAGLPLTVSATTAFETKYQLLSRENGGHDPDDIIWGVRSAIVGCLLARPLRTYRGKALLVEFPSFQRGACKDVRIVIWMTDQSQVCLMLPEEYQEPSAASN